MTWNATWNNLQDLQAFFTNNCYFLTSSFLHLSKDFKVHKLPGNVKATFRCKEDFLFMFCNMFGDFKSLRGITSIDNKTFIVPPKYPVKIIKFVLDQKGIIWLELELMKEMEYTIDSFQKLLDLESSRKKFNKSYNDGLSLQVPLELIPFTFKDAKLDDISPDFEEEEPDFFLTRYACFSYEFELSHQKRISFKLLAKNPGKKTIVDRSQSIIEELYTQLNKEFNELIEASTFTSLNSMFMKTSHMPRAFNMAYVRLRQLYDKENVKGDCAILLTLTLISIKGDVFTASEMLTHKLLRNSKKIIDERIQLMVNIKELFFCAENLKSLNQSETYLATNIFGCFKKIPNTKSVYLNFTNNEIFALLLSTFLMQTNSKNSVEEVQVICKDCGMSDKTLRVFLNFSNLKNLKRVFIHAKENNFSVRINNELDNFKIVMERLERLEFYSDNTGKGENSIQSRGIESIPKMVANGKRFF